MNRQNCDIQRHEILQCDQFSMMCYIFENELIISNDILDIDDEIFFSQIRVIFINRDHRFQAYTSKKIVIIIQSMINWQHFYFQNIEHVRDDHEMIIIENVNYEISFDVLLRRSNVYLNRDYDDENDEETFVDAEIYIRRIYNLKSKIFRSICRLHSTREELKIDYFDREYVEDFFSALNFFLSYFLFINAFGVHRNMYRFLKVFYLISANLFYEKRRKLANVFTLTLDSHDATLDNVVKIFFKFIRELDRNLNIEINEKMIEMCSYVMTLIDDMSQQVENEDFSHHNIQKNCRICFILKNVREDLEFDIIKNERYHFEILKQRKHAKQLVDENQRTFLKNTRLQLKSLVIARLCSFLNLIRTRVYDASHSEWRDLKRIMHRFLVSNVFFKSGSAQYLKIFQTFQYFFDWSRIQSFMFYIDSWFLSEIERIFILFFWFFDFTRSWNDFVFFIFKL